MTITEVGDKFTGYAHQGHAESKVVVEDENGCWRDIDDLDLVPDANGTTHLVIKLK